MPFSFPEGRTYSPPRRRKVRLPPFPPLAKTAATPLLLLSPQSRLCGDPFPAVVLLLRISRALSEGDAAPAGALAAADDTPYHRLRHGHHRLSTSCAAPLPPTAREWPTPWLTIFRSADREMGTRDAWGERRLRYPDSIKLASSLISNAGIE